VKDKTIKVKIVVVRHGHVANHQGDVALLPEGRLAAFNAGFHFADQVADSSAITVLYSPTLRTRETAQELASGLISGLLVQNKTQARVSLPRHARARAAICNFQFIIDGQQTPPTDSMHASLPASAAHNLFFQGFWEAKQDPIGYWLNHPSENAEPPAIVAARLGAFIVSLLNAASSDVYFLVTHSGPMRAFLRQALGADPGEPDFCEAFQVDASGVRYRGHAGLRGAVAHSNEKKAYSDL
jgi:broad specificity phosphatase PhoE